MFLHIDSAKVKRTTALAPVRQRSNDELMTLRINQAESIQQQWPTAQWQSNHCNFDNHSSNQRENFNKRIAFSLPLLAQSTANGHLEASCYTEPEETQRKSTQGYKRSSGYNKKKSQGNFNSRHSNLWKKSHDTNFVSHPLTQHHNDRKYNTSWQSGYIDQQEQQQREGGYSKHRARNYQANRLRGQQGLSSFQNKSHGKNVKYFPTQSDNHRSTSTTNNYNEEYHQNVAYEQWQPIAILGTKRADALLPLQLGDTASNSQSQTEITVSNYNNNNNNNCFVIDDDQSTEDAVITAEHKKSNIDIVCGSLTEFKLNKNQHRHKYGRNNHWHNSLHNKSHGDYPSPYAANNQRQNAQIANTNMLRGCAAQSQLNKNPNRCWDDRNSYRRNFRNNKTNNSNQKSQFAAHVNLPYYEHEATLGSGFLEPKKFTDTPDTFAASDDYEQTTFEGVNVDGKFKPNLLEMLETQAHQTNDKQNQHWHQNGHNARKAAYFKNHSYNRDGDYDGGFDDYHRSVAVTERQLAWQAIKAEQSIYANDSAIIIAHAAKRVITDTLLNTNFELTTSAMDQSQQKGHRNQQQKQQQKQWYSSQNSQSNFKTGNRHRFYQKSSTSAQLNFVQPNHYDSQYKSSCDSLNSTLPQKLRTMVFTNSKAYARRNKMYLNHISNNSNKNTEKEANWYGDRELYYRRQSWYRNTHPTPNRIQSRLTEFDLTPFSPVDASIKNTVRKYSPNFRMYFNLYTPVIRFSKQPQTKMKIYVAHNKKKKNKNKMKSKQLQSKKNPKSFPVMIWHNGNCISDIFDDEDSNWENISNSNLKFDWIPKRDSSTDSDSDSDIVYSPVLPLPDKSDSSLYYAHSKLYAWPLCEDPTKCSEEWTRQHENQSQFDPYNTSEKD